MNPIKIILLTEEYLDEAAALEQSCFTEPWSRQQLADAISDDRTVLFAAVEGDTLIGYAGLTYVLEEGSVTDVAVFPDHRRKGAGGMLVDALKEECRKRKLSFLTLEVRVSNQGAIALYESRGFTPVGRRRNFYRKPTEDALLMTWFRENTENE